MKNILREKNIEVDLEAFNIEMDLQKKRAKQSWSGSGAAKDDDIYFNLKEKLGKEVTTENESLCSEQG